MTVAKLLANTGDDGEQGREAWIVDEASMLSAGDAARMRARADAAHTCLILVGDVAQLASVEAGHSFGQLQDEGMTTFVLDEIARQINPHTRQAIEAMLAGHAAKAFAALDTGGGAVVEPPTPISAMPSSRATSPGCRLTTAPTPSSSTRPATAASSSPTPFARR